MSVTWSLEGIVVAVVRRGVSHVKRAVVVVSRLGTRAGMRSRVGGCKVRW